MSDTLQPDEMRKLKRQRQGEEDPVVVAQRFLNIFRQLHIFGPDKRTSFNQMLLELKPEIKSVFGTLPGGSVIQDYIAELGENNTAETVADTETSDEQAPQSQILASALAETQSQPTQILQQPAAPTIVPQAQISSKVELGQNFAKDLASALSSVLNTHTPTAAPLNIAAPQSSQEMLKLVENFEKSQQAIIQILQDEKKDRKTENQNLTKMILASQHQLAASLQQKETTSQSLDIVNTPLFKTLAENQMQLAKMLSSVENKASVHTQELQTIFETSQQEFSSVMKSLSAAHQEDNKILVQAITSSQKELAQILANNQNQQQQNASANSQNANNIQINSTDYSAQLALIAERLGNLQAPSQTNFSPDLAIEKIIKAQSRLYTEALSAQTKELAAVIKLALQESQKLSNETLLSVLEKMPRSEVRYIQESPSSQTIPLTEATDVTFSENISEEITAQTEDNPIQDTSVIEDEPLPEIPSVSSEETITESLLISEEAPKKKKKKKKKKKVVDEVTVTPETTEQTEEASSSSLVTEESASDFSSESSLDELLTSDIPTQEENIILPTEESVSEVQRTGNPFAGKSSVFQIQFDEDTSSDDTPITLTQEQDSSPAYDWGLARSADNSYSKTNTLTKSLSWNDGDFDISMPKSNETTEQDDENWEWEYVEEDTDTSQDWEWEYVEEDESKLPIAENSPIYSGDLFFQNALPDDVEPFIAETRINLDTHNILIKDSQKNEDGQDPYQNSNPKH